MKTNFFQGVGFHASPLIQRCLNLKLREIVIVFLLTSLVPFARASILPGNCSQFSGEAQQDCQNILSDSSLSLSEKEDLYLNLIANQSRLPSHDFAWNWNQSITWASTPANVVPQSNGIIKNAWVKIVAVDKSFFDLNKQEWFFSLSGRVLVEKKHSIELPQDPLPGDCRTDYAYELLEDSLSVKLNGLNIGSSRVSNYFTSLGDGAQMVFSVSFIVRAKLIMQRYRLTQQCFWFGRDLFCTNNCLPYATEYRVDSVNASDSFTGKARVENIDFRVAVENAPLKKVFLSIDSDKEINFFELNFGSNSFGFGESVFDLNFTRDGIVFVTRNNKQQKELQGLIELDANTTAKRFVFVAPSVESCSVKLFTVFEEKDLACNLVELQPVKLEVETDANSYDFNRQIVVKVNLSDSFGTILSNKKVLLRAGESTELVTDSSGVAQAIVSAGDSKGVIAVDFAADGEFGSSSAVKRVALFNSESLGGAEQVAGFFGAYYFVFLIAKKFWIGW